MKTLKKLWDKKYTFIEGSCYGESILEDFEDVEDTFEEIEENEWLSLEVEIDHNKQIVYMFIHNDE